MVNTIISAAHMANADVASFGYDFSSFIEKSRFLMVENVTGNPEKLDDPASMIQTCANMSGFLEGVAADSPSGKRRIYHAVHEQPDEYSLATMEGLGIDNIHRMTHYLRANAAAAALATALNAQRGEEAHEASLNAMLHRDASVQTSPCRTPDAYEAAALEECRNNTLITDQVAAYLLETLGSRGIGEVVALAQRIGVTNLADAEKAEAFLHDAKSVFSGHGADFAATRETLDALLSAPELPSHSYAELIARQKEDRMPATHGRR